MGRFKAFVAAGTFLSLACLTGCAFLAGAAVAGAGFAYVSGEGKKTYDRDVRSVYDAALGTVKDMGLALVDKRVDDTSGIVKAKQADGDNVNIRIKRISEDSCKVMIRVGLMGDESDTRLLFSKIDERL